VSATKLAPRGDNSKSRRRTVELSSPTGGKPMHFSAIGTVAEVTAMVERTWPDREILAWTSVQPLLETGVFFS
jgi:hypothetical protein